MADEERLSLSFRVKIVPPLKKTGIFSKGVSTVVFFPPDTST
jgi:hypothetical protein